MATSPRDDTDGPLAAAVEAIGTALDDLAASSWLSATPSQLSRALTGLTRLTARLTAAQLQVAAEADRAAVGSEVGASSAASWWAHQTKATGRATRSAVRLAHDLEPAGRCPLVGAALADGLVLDEQARVIVRAIADLPQDLDASRRELAEKTLIALAGEHDADALRILGRGILTVVAPDVAEEAERRQIEDDERRAWEEIRFSMTDDGQGMTRGRFTIPTAQAHALRKILLAFLARQRRASHRADQAATDSADTTASSGEAADQSAADAHDHSDPADHLPSWLFDDGAGGVHGDTDQDGTDQDGPDQDGTDQDGTDQDGTDQDGTDQDGTGCHDHRPTHTQARAEARVGPRAMGEAFVAMVEAFPIDAMPHHGGVNPTLVATLTLDQLCGTGDNAQTPVALDTGEKVSAGQARRWACSAGIIPAVLGTDSVVLDMGRRARFHSPRQRLALALRDRGCVAVGCDRPPAMCQAHHVRQWVRDRGPTNTTDGVLLCGHHHRLVHDPAFDHEIRPDGTLAFARRT